MSEEKVNKALNESLANVEVEETYHEQEELDQIKESLMNSESSYNVLKKIIRLHKNKKKEDKNDKKL